MAKNTSILLGEHFEKFITSEISAGRYASASEVVRTALRMLQSEEEKIYPAESFDTWRKI